jgi:hypothetical protein
MPETQVVDEVVADRTATRANNARPVVNETVAASGGAAARTDRNGIEEDSIGEGGRKGRTFKESTEKLLSTMDAPAKPAKPALAPHEMGDADEDEPADDADQDADDASDPDDTDAADGEGDASADDAEGDGEEKTPEAPDPVAEVRAQAARLEQRNRELIGELETARKTPKAERSDRETALLSAEATYIEEGSVPALRKFLGVVVGAAPDSKEVDAELAGLYLDLTAREVGVPLDENQQSKRDNARTRLLLARDKREKIDAGKKVEPGNDAAETVQYEQAAKYVDNLLTVKGDSGSSLADEFPMLMDLAENFDQMPASQVLARAVRQEYMAGTIDPSGSEIDAIRIVAQKIENHYDAVAKKIEAARAKKQSKTNTTKPSGKPPKVAPEQSQGAAQKPQARTITNATASRAPAKPPKTTKQKAPTTTEKARKDFKSDAAWRQHLLDKHFES